MVRALIVDDEEPGRVNLRYALADHPRWQIAGECPSVAAAQACIAAQDIDVVFLDIQMPGDSGLVLARALAGLANPPLVIFVTAHNAFALEAFEVHALDYLLKPVHDARLAAALARAEAMLELRQRPAYGAALRAWADAGDERPGTPERYWQQVSVRSVGRIECIRLGDVDWIETCGNYVSLHVAARKVMHRLPLSRLLAHLDPACFLRVHRGAVVRTSQAANLEAVGDGAWRLTLRSGVHVAVSERYVEALRAAMRER
ncbi:LytTR family DNA-binding domain-containing protein [Massilia sp. P8910]|uniref:LytR/AlgR family response regulator transcription factor n=1 Tax=Massilia antarctica TaxID=2765360 RepID=UPI0006BB67D1|nr:MULTISPECIES: LytTR family DNA-binding domain-containing protein [Massilia]MCE3606688.1 LytTR family DNA-binding domain-containing protein [Massilia antarctica]MCY0914985.1 LytTR family DNA-binding domain-containing protein [Massilia sp. H27-R4]CUI06953.1 two-component system response regulator protein [Janthinobacterium sp. CG23_2]CUU30739.1 two-component system response regulator protein [Janthinobacterium sp. CG23_2]